HREQLKRHLFVHIFATVSDHDVLKDFPWTSKVNYGDALRDSKRDGNLSFSRRRELVARGRKETTGKRFRERRGGYDYSYTGSLVHKLSSLHFYLQRDS